MSKDDPQKFKPFIYMDELPDPDKNPEFWRDIQSIHVRNNINFLVLNEIRKYEPELMDDNQCRVQLSKLKAMVELMDSPKGLLMSKDSTDARSNEDIPEEH